jgi:hypothetical protein
MIGANAMKTIHSLRMVAACSLLGAVVTGIATGWVDSPPFDLRAIGAAIGAMSAIAMQVLHA